MGNPNHDERGRFASGSSAAAAVGDHQKVSPSTSTRNVGGVAVGRARPVARHVGVESVNTEPPRSRLSANARDTIIRNKAIDARHYPITTDRSIAAKTDLMGSRPVAAGKLDPRTSTLVAGGAKPRIRVRATTR
jgi:hypothetical protein